MASAPQISGFRVGTRSRDEILSAIGTALLQVKTRERMNLPAMADRIGRSDEMTAQYLSGEAEMGVTAWLRAVEKWPDLPDRVAYQLDEAEKAFRARQRELRLNAPQPEVQAA